MPTYYPLHTKVHLHASSLVDSTTPAPERQKGRSATLKTEEAVKAMLNGRVLKETPITFGEDNARLHFIGPDGVPFYLMHAGEESRKPPGEETVIKRALQRLKLYQERSGKPASRSISTTSTLTSLDPDEALSDPQEDQVDLVVDPNASAPDAPPMTPNQQAQEIEEHRLSPIQDHELPNNSWSTSAALPNASAVPTNQHSLWHGAGTQEQDRLLTPRALALSLSLSDQAFLRKFDKQKTLQDVKIDTYVNGDLIESTCVPARGVGDNKSKVAQESMLPVFSGKRVHRMAERALILVPPHQNASGSMRSHNHSKVSLAGLEERWEQVNAAILDDANKRGFNDRGERPPVGAYLASLAALPMPAAIQDFQKTGGGPKFGVIDVVLSVGTGWKFGPTSSYLMQPTRMMDSDFAPRPEGDPSALSNPQGAQIGKVASKEDRSNLNDDNPPLANEPTELLEEIIENSDQKEPQLPPPPDRPHTPQNDNYARIVVDASTLTTTQSVSITLDPPVIFPASQQRSIESSPGSESSQRGKPRRVVGLAELQGLLGKSFDSPSVMPSSQHSMPPPQTPLSSLKGPPHKRRRSDTIQLSEAKSPAKRNRGSTSKGDSFGPVGITRRGRFTRDGKDLTGSPKGLAAAETITQSSPIKTSPIRRVIIKNHGQTIVDKDFAVAQPLFHKNAAIPTIPSSPVYPLSEDIIFGTQNTTSTLMPPPTFHPPTPLPSSSPTRKPRHSSSSSSPLKASQTPFVRRKRIRIRDQNGRADELHAAWKFPELSQGSFVSYAEDGEWRVGAKEGKGGVWRQIRSARPGYFKENEVLFGVRYVVG